MATFLMATVRFKATSRRRAWRFPLLALAVAAATLALAGCASAPDTATAAGQLTIGSRAARQGLWREAMFRYQKAVQIEPNNAMALSNLGVAYESEGDFEKAREAYLKALQNDRANPYIQKNYSRFSEFYQKYKKREPKVLDGDKGAEQAPEPPKPPAVPEEKQP